VTDYRFAYDSNSCCTPPGFITSLSARTRPNSRFSLVCFKTFLPPIFILSFSQYCCRCLRLDFPPSSSLGSSPPPPSYTPFWERLIDSGSQETISALPPFLDLQLILSLVLQNRSSILTDSHNQGFPAPFPCCFLFCFFRIKLLV